LRFWDSSALVPLFVEHPTSTQVRSWIDDDPDVVAWTLSDVDLRSAFARLAREGHVSWKDAQETFLRVDAFFARIHVVTFIDGVKARARRLLGVHPLRAADALQLASALLASSDDPAGFELVTLDERLAEAARREGFTVRP
jgi:hypothetical protein